MAMLSEGRNGGLYDNHTLCCMIIIQTVAGPIKMTMAGWGLLRNLLSLNCVKEQHAIGKQ